MVKELEERTNEIIRKFKKEYEKNHQKPFKHPYYSKGEPFKYI